MTEGIQVFVLGVARKFFQSDKNIFEAGEVVATDGDATESFQERGEKRGGFRRLLLGKRGKSELGQFFGKLIGPEALEQWRKFTETRSNDTASGGIGVFQTASVVQQNGAGFAARGVGTGFDQLRERLTNYGNGHAPNISAAENGGFFARS